MKTSNVALTLIFVVFVVAAIMHGASVQKEKAPDSKNVTVEVSKPKARYTVIINYTANTGVEIAASFQVNNLSTGGGVLYFINPENNKLVHASKFVVFEN